MPYADVPTRAELEAGVRVLGIARDARDWFFDELVTDHGPSFSGGPGGFLPALAHVQTADALNMIAEAERHAHRLAAMVDTMTEEDSARARADLIALCRLAGDAVHIFAATSRSEPIRGMVRDLAAAVDEILTTDA